jgi:NAD(P)-dependent dehydrogenase (short-subunit alcohol dehydrogenase family)
MPGAYEKFDLLGKTALVTGGATGIGYHIARALMRSGATVLIAARREAVLDEAAASLRAQSPTGAISHRCVDLASRASIRELTDHVTKTMGGVDILVGNAAQNILEPIDDITDQAFDLSFQINVSANIELTRAFLPAMRRKKWGRILFSSSAGSEKSAAQGGMAVYNATKSALNSFVRSAAAEAGHDGITVNSLIFGVFMTKMLSEAVELVQQSQGEAAAKAFTDAFSSMTALGRLARCDEVEGLIQLLASDAGSYITASNLAIDGGLTAMLRPNMTPQTPVYPPIV